MNRQEIHGQKSIYKNPFSDDPDPDPQEIKRFI